jgi:hypothetical protein
MSRIHLFKRNPLEKLSDYFDDKIQKVIGPPSKEHKNAATAEEWVEYKKKSVEHCPFLYFCKKTCDEIDIYLSVKWRKYVTDPIYAVKQRFIYKNWMVHPEKIKKTQYVEPLTMVLHANMQIIKDFVEKELGGKPWEVREFEEHGNFDHHEQSEGLMGQYKERKAVWDIYLWWENYEKREEEIYAVLDGIESTGDIMVDLSKVNREKHKSVYEKHREMEKKLEDEVEKNLITIMKIRNSLWR